MNLRVISRKFGVVTDDSKYRGYNIRLSGEVTAYSFDVLGNMDECDHDTDIQIEVTGGHFVSLKEIVAVFNSTCKVGAVAAKGQGKQDKD